MRSSLSVRPSTVPPRPPFADLPCAALLPLLEEKGAPWLHTLAQTVLALVEKTLAIKILPMQTVGVPVTTPLPIWRAQPLVIVPWSLAQECSPCASGSEIFHFFNLARVLETSPLVTLPRPRPALSELMSLSFLGGWDASSHTGLSQLITICPGWDEMISLRGPVCVLRSSQPSVPTALPPSAQCQNYVRLLRSAYGGEQVDARVVLDMQCTELYLSRILTATIRVVIAAQQQSTRETGGNDSCVGR